MKINKKENKTLISSKIFINFIDLIIILNFIDKLTCKINYWQKFMKILAI